MSQVGCEILLKVVIQVIPNFTIACFKLPLGLCNDIEAIIKIFFWGRRGDRRKIHCLKWDEMTKSKIMGGMRFRDLAIFNCKVVIYNYILCWLYSMTKSVVIALILFLVFCGILLYWV